MIAAYPGSLVGGRHIIRLDGVHTVIAELKKGEWVLTFKGEQLAKEMFGR